jgi:catechol 2,3-dioxygenase-like lactoylglutathione lyase family enzyme
MVTNLAHLCFTVRDLDAAQAFYCDGLGLRHGFDFLTDTGERHGLYLQVGGGSFIELFRGEHGGDGAPSYRHFCLEVDDLAATVAALRAKDIAVTDPKLGSDQSWQAWLSDPDGNRIELHQYTPESWQVTRVG